MSNTHARTSTTRPARAARRTLLPQGLHLAPYFSENSSGKSLRFVMLAISDRHELAGSQEIELPDLQILAFDHSKFLMPGVYVAPWRPMGSNGCGWSLIAIGPGRHFVASMDVSSRSHRDLEVARRNLMVILEVAEAKRAEENRQADDAQADGK